MSCRSRFLSSHRAPEIPVAAGGADEEDGLSHRDAPGTSKWRGASFGCLRAGETARQGTPFHPLNYKISHGKFFSPPRARARAPEVRAPSRTERPRHIANNEDRWRGLWRPDTVPRLLIGRINQRFHPAASHLPPLSFLPLLSFRLWRTRPPCLIFVAASIYIFDDDELCFPSSCPKLAS